MSQNNDGYNCPKEHQYHYHNSWPPKPTRIEAIIICVNYSDFLAHTLPNNKQHLDKIIVVTDTKDTATKNLCTMYNIECLQTDVFYENGEKFNKGKGINAGLDKLSKLDWVVTIDADIWLSPHTRGVLDNRHLDPEAIYGIDRMMCHGHTNWINFLENPRAINEQYYLVQANNFPVGSRVAHYNQSDGWFPIGFFQLWNPKKSNIHKYPIEWDGADHYDVVFAKTFPRGKRYLIPETYVIYLDSETNKEMGMNWKGRKTKQFKLGI